MKQPKKDEHWHVNNTSLTGKESNSIVKVLEDKILTVPNWRKHKYKCDRKGDVVYINGDYFVERFT